VQALSPNGGMVVLKGNLCPDGALIKVTGLQSLTFTGPALVFENEEDCMQGGACTHLCGRCGDHHPQ